MDASGMATAGTVDDYFERFRAISTAALSDVLDKLSIRGVVSGVARRSGTGRVVGSARTVTCETGDFGRFSESEFSVFPIFESVGPGDMLVFDLDGAETSTFGGLAAFTLASRGAAGVIIDGACRDLEELRGSGLTVASKHVTPRSGRGRMRISARGAAIRCGGVQVCDGDIIVLDDTGIVVIPPRKVEEILRQAEALEVRDQSAAMRILSNR